jgi:hypothetical protein
MSPFSLQVREEVMSTFPEWEEYAAEETWKDSDPYLVVTVPAPKSADTELPLRISTWDEEITVDFDYYHTHFDRWAPQPGDTRHQSAQLYVQELLAETFAVASWWQDKHCKVCGQVEPGAAPKPPVKIAYTRVRVRSWKGNQNAAGDA